MKKILLFALLFSWFAASAQHPGYAPKVNSYGNAYNRIIGDSAVHIPNKNISLNDNDTTPQLFVAKDSLRGFWNGNFYNFGHGNNGGGGTYTADEVSIHLSGTQFQIKPTWVGQTSIVTVGNLSTGALTTGFTPVNDAQISSSAVWNAKQTSVLSSALIWVGNGSNVATAVTPSGDLSITNAGVFTFNNVVSGASCTNCNLTINNKGLVTALANGTGGGGSTPFPDNSAIVENNSDHTKLLIFGAANITTLTTRTLQSPDANGQITLDNNITTLTNKTIAAGSNTISGLTNANLNGSAGITNANLANNSITINSNATALGASFNVTDANLVTSNVTTNNASITKHGFVPILPNDATKYYDGTGNYSTPSGSGSTLTRQVITSGSSATVTGGNYLVTFDLSSTASSFALTFPASPSDKDIVKIDAAGTSIPYGTVITSFSVLPNTSQTIYDSNPPSTFIAGVGIEYQYRTSNTSWYRHY